MAKVQGLRSYAFAAGGTHGPLHGAVPTGWPDRNRYAILRLCPTRTKKPDVLMNDNTVLPVEKDFDNIRSSRIVQSMPMNAHESMGRKARYPRKTCGISFIRMHAAIIVARRRV